MLGLMSSTCNLQLETFNFFMPLDLEKKLATARTRLILEKPFLGALVLRLPMVPANPDWCAATFSDGKKFYYNPQYIEALNPDQTQFALAHEALHCALLHFARRQHRIKHRWDMACDLAINQRWHDSPGGCTVSARIYR